MVYGSFNSASGSRGGVFYLGSYRAWSVRRIFGRPSQKTLDVMLGFAGGVMIAASFWSLLAPAISISEELGYPGWLPPAVGFLAGGISLRLIDMLMPHLHPSMARERSRRASVDSAQNNSACACHNSAQYPRRTRGGSCIRSHRYDRRRNFRGNNGSSYGNRASKLSQRTPVSNAS